MRTPWKLLAVLALTACGSPELTELEKEHADLKKQVAELKTTVGTLRADMVEAGLVSPRQAKMRVADGDDAGGDEEEGGKAGKARRRGKGGDKEPSGFFSSPTNELSSALSFTAARSGELPALPPLGEVERVESECGYKVVLRDLQPISDYPLNNAGLGKSGPVLMLENGKPMIPHATPDQFEKSCAGAFRHAGYAFFFSPTGSVEAAEQNTYTLALADEVPLPRGDDGRPMYWVYPGTTLTFSFAEGWDPAWGELTVGIAGRTPLPGEAGATIRLLGKELELAQSTKPGGFSFAEGIADPPSGPFTIEIESPADGPYVVLGALTLGNAENALVVTAGEATAASKEDE